MFFLVKQKPFFFLKALAVPRNPRSGRRMHHRERVPGKTAKRGRNVEHVFQLTTIYNIFHCNWHPQYISIHPQFPQFPFFPFRWFLHISSCLISPKSKEIRCLSTTYRLIDFWGLLFFCQSCLLHLQSGHFTAPHCITFTFEKSLSSSFEGAFLASRQKSGHSTSCVSYSYIFMPWSQQEAVVCLASNVVTWSIHDQTRIWRRDKKRNIKPTSSATLLFSPTSWHLLILMSDVKKTLDFSACFFWQWHIHFIIFYPSCEVRMAGSNRGTMFGPGIYLADSVTGLALVLY